MIVSLKLEQLLPVTIAICGCLVCMDGCICRPSMHDIRLEEIIHVLPSLMAMGMLEALTLGLNNIVCWLAALDSHCKP